MHDPIDDQLAIVLGQRQLMAVCCMFLTVLGLVATLAYVAGRTITAAQVQAREGAIPDMPQPMVVDPPRALEARAASLPERTQAPILPAVPAAISAAPMPSVIVPARNNSPAALPAPVQTPIAIGTAVAAPVIIPQRPPVTAVRPPAAVASLSTEPAKGQTFWQIGLVDPDTARQMENRALGLGMPARIAAGNTPQSRRVLVGPLVSREDIARIKQTLDGQQMQAFLKIY